MSKRIEIIIHQEAQVELSAKCYDDSIPIATIFLENELLVQVTKATEVSHKKIYHTFRIGKRKPSHEPFETTATTNYHKAIGLAIKMACEE